MHALRWVAYSILAGILLGYGFVAFNVRGASADTPGNTAVTSAVPSDLGLPVVSSGYCVNGSVPGPYGCTSTIASSSYYNYPYNYYYPYNPYYPNYANYYYNYNLYNCYNAYYPYYDYTYYCH
jgi:hypothetical protein